MKKSHSVQLKTSIWHGSQSLSLPEAQNLLCERGARCVLPLSSDLEEGERRKVNRVILIIWSSVRAPPASALCWAHCKSPDMHLGELHRSPVVKGMCSPADLPLQYPPIGCSCSSIEDSPDGPVLVLEGVDQLTACLVLHSGSQWHLVEPPQMYLVYGTGWTQQHTHRK